jgi:sarcosine oxidase, subunit alpha
MNRLTSIPTLKIDTSKRLLFSYEGSSYEGYDGDTIASAMFANGIRIFGRSLKYHRPRGLYSLDGECSNTLMQVDGIPNLNVEKTLLKAGMSVKAQNVLGTAERDWYGILDKFDKMMPAGFYYQVMHKPAAIWPIAMRNIRKMAGIGKLDPAFEMKGTYDQIFPKTDVCVIGGGPSGMSAALAAGEAGKRVILIEARPYLGGFFQYRTADYNNKKSLSDRAEELIQQVRAQPNIRLLAHSSMVGAYNNNLITGFQVGSERDNFDQRYFEIRAESVVVATGCIERPLMFEHNEKPGVMQVACAHRLAHNFGLLPGKIAVFSIGTDLGLEAAVDLHDKGLKIECIADLRCEGQDEVLVSAIKSRGISYFKAWVATEAHGKKRVNKVTLRSLNENQSKTIACDVIVASAGHTPLMGPITVALGKLKYDKHTTFFLPETLPAKTHICGRLLGLEDPEAIETTGTLAGLKAANDCGASVEKKIKASQNALKALPGPVKGNELVMAPVTGNKSFLCFDEDVTVKHIKQAIGMGFDVPELIKRFTSAGLGPGQGGIPGHNLPLFVSKHITGTVDNTKPTNVRAPIVGTYIATFAASNHDMAKRTPIDQIQKDDGGIFRRIGVWKRARYFSRDFSCEEEILNVRNNVGILDGSTLGKFRIHGPDALKALQRVYISNVATLKPGKIKYSAMCNDDGCVIDDGVLVKERENDYYFTTSTGRAGHTVEWLRYHTRYDDWNFSIVNLTDALGVINLSGPNARRVLEKVIADPISNDDFPFSAYRNYSIENTIPIKAMRLGFVGELSYELHVPASYMAALWKMVVNAGQEFGIRNFGVEAQNVLRMEKGHIILGQESEQRTNLLDVGMGFLFARKLTAEKKVGAVALKQAENNPDRLKLVGIKMDDSERPAKDGSIIVDKKIQGYVCTMRKSLSLNQSVGMALVESSLTAVGTALQIYEDDCKGKTLSATVAPMPFYDPDGGRMKM